MLPAELKRFERFVDKLPQENGCWIWHGSMSGDNPRMRVGSTRDNTRRSANVARLYYEHVNGPVPKDLYVLSKCGNHYCVNPDHRVVGDRQTLADLKSEHGTHRTGNNKGGNNPRAKLSDRQVFDILWLRRDQTNTELGAIYGVHHTTIGMLRQGKTFAHVPRPEHVKYQTMKMKPVAEIGELRDEGLGYDRIAKRVGVSKSFVARRVRKNIL
jgi:hypothetical protein